jgi:hypothetical protein
MALQVFGLGDRLGKYYGPDATFIDKDEYDRHYRSSPPPAREEI